MRDVLVATHYSDVLLMAGRGADEVEAVAEHGLAVVRELVLDTYETNSLVANVVIAWIRAGRIARAAGIVDELTDSAMVLDRWILHLERMVLDLARGRWDEARERAERLRAMDRVSMDYMVGDQASLLVWTGEPEQALGLIEDVLRAPDHIETHGEMGQLLVLAARAAADLAAQGLRDPASLARRLSDLHAAVHRDPFGPDTVTVDRHAAPQWAAEGARLDGADSLELWTRAAESWDAIAWPHDAAYCRWRAAQCALRDNRGTVAARLLKRAARDAREHVPLSEAIARTAAG